MRSSITNNNTITSMNIRQLQIASFEVLLEKQEFEAIFLYARQSHQQQEQQHSGQEQYHEESQHHEQQHSEQVHHEQDYYQQEHHQQQHNNYEHHEQEHSAVQQHQNYEHHEYNQHEIEHHQDEHHDVQEHHQHDQHGQVHQEQVHHDSNHQEQEHHHNEQEIQQAESNEQHHSHEQKKIEQQPHSQLAEESKESCEGKGQEIKSEQQGDQHKVAPVQVLDPATQQSTQVEAQPARTLQEDRLSKDSAMKSVCLQRKKDSFNELKMWEEKRSAFLMSHKKVIENILSRIEKRVRISQESMVQFLRFFKERRDQEQSYSKLYSTKVPLIGHCWHDPADKSVDWYPSLTNALKETDDYNLKQGNNISALSIHIDKMIIKQVLIPENEEFEKKTKQLRNNISDQLSKLEKATTYAIRKNSNYAQLYTVMVTDELMAGKLKKKRKDLLNLEIKFRQAAFEEISEQKALGQHALNFWEEAKKLECARLEVISKVFSMYIQKHQETYGQLAQMQTTLGHFTQFDCAKETTNSFGVGVILGSDDLSSIRRTLGVNEETGLDWDDVLKYLTNFNFKDMNISQHQLVQKKFKILRDVGSVTKSFRECWMVATVDDVLVFYDEINQKQTAAPAKSSTIADGGKKVNNSPKKKFRLDCMQVKQREDKSLIDLIEKTPGLLFESTQKQLIKFIREDDFEEFKVFMLRYSNSPIKQ